MASEKLADFFNFLSIEKGLSKNTTEAYRRDLDRFFHYLSINQLSVEQVTAEDLSMYVAWLRGMNNSDVNLNLNDIETITSAEDLITTVKLKGKGGKERVVPIGSFAVTAVNDYLARARPKLSKVSTQKALFLNQRGGRLTRQSAWNIVAKAAHSSVTTTQIYTLITIDRLRESYSSAHPRSK